MLTWQRMWCTQMEIDYKSECMAGQTVESLGNRVQEDTNGSGVLRSDQQHPTHSRRVDYQATAWTAP